MASSLTLLGEERARRSVMPANLSCAFAPDGDAVFLGNVKGELWALPTADAIPSRTRLRRPHGIATTGINSLSVGPTNELLASADQSIKFWKVPDVLTYAAGGGKKPPTEVGKVYPSSAPSGDSMARPTVNTLAWWGDDKLVLGTNDGELGVVDAPTATLVGGCKGSHRGPVSEVCACGVDLFASAGADGVVKIWDARQDSVVRSLEPWGRDLLQALESRKAQTNPGEPTESAPAFTQRSIACYTVAAHGDLLAVGGESNMIQLWHIPTGRLLTVLPMPAPVDRLVFSSPNQLMAACWDGTVTVWGGDGRQLASCKSELDSILGFSVSKSAVPATDEFGPVFMERNTVAVVGNPGFVELYDPCGARFAVLG